MEYLEFFIANAYAQGGGGGGRMQFFVDMIPIVFLFVVFYFVFIRPQAKRTKDHKKMMEALGKGDEIVTTGGLLGRVLEIGDNFILVDIGKGIEVKVQRTAVSTTVPKGTIKTL